MSVKVTKHGTVRYVSYGFLLVRLVTLSLRCAVFHFKNVLTLKSGSRVNQGHRNWYQSTAEISYGFLLVFYRNFSLIHTVFEIFSIHLEMGLGVTEGN